MNRDRVFIELHKDDDLVLIDVDQIQALVARSRRDDRGGRIVDTRVILSGRQRGLSVDENLGAVIRTIRQAYENLHAMFGIQSIGPDE
jgi:hypothetical protein